MEFMTDLSSFLSVGSASDEVKVKHSTNTKAGSDLDMSDYLQLMIATFKNQSIDDTASTSDMVNQMVQMSVIQTITKLNSIVSESSSMNYAASLVGKEVTIGYDDGYEVKQYVGKVTGTGMLDGEQVIFIGKEMFKLSDVIAVGRVPSDTAPIELKTESTDSDSKSESTKKTQSSGGSSGTSGTSETSGSSGSGGLVEAKSTDGVNYAELYGSGSDYNSDDFVYVQDESGALRVVYQGEADGGTPNYGVQESMLPGADTAEQAQQAEAEAAAAAAQQQTETQAQDLTDPLAIPNEAYEAAAAELAAEE